MKSSIFVAARFFKACYPDLIVFVKSSKFPLSLMPPLGKICKPEIWYSAPEDIGFQSGYDILANPCSAM